VFFWCKNNCHGMPEGSLVIGQNSALKTAGFGLTRTIMANPNFCGFSVSFVNEKLQWYCETIVEKRCFMELPTFTVQEDGLFAPGERMSVLS